MSWMSAVAAVGSVASGYLGSKGAKDAANAAAQAGDAAAQVQWDMYDQMRTDLMPWRTSGVRAQNQLALAMGLGESGTQNFDAFYQSPDYQFRFDEGMKAVNASGAARGMALSGQQLKSLAQYGAGMASQGYGDWFNRLYSLSQMGQNSAVQTGAAGQTAASNAGNAMMSAGNARATGYIDSANAYGNALMGVTRGVSGYLEDRKLKDQAFNMNLGATMPNQGLY